jgi:hypothetical protein
MVFSLEHDIKVTKNHQNLLPTQSVLVAHTVFRTRNLGQHFLDVFKKNDVNQSLVSLINDNY